MSFGVLPLSLYIGLRFATCTVSSGRVWASTINGLGSNLLGSKSSTDTNVVACRMLPVSERSTPPEPDNLSFLPIQRTSSVLSRKFDCIFFHFLFLTIRRWPSMNLSQTSGFKMSEWRLKY